MSIYLQHILQIRQLWIRELGLLVVDIVLYLVDQLGVIRYLYYNISSGPCPIKDKKNAELLARYLCEESNRAM